MPSCLPVLRARFAVLAALVLCLAALVVLPGSASAGTCTPASATVTTWAEYRVATSAITACAAGDTFTVNVANGFSYSSGTGLAWSYAGSLVIQGNISSPPVLDMTGADTYVIRHSSAGGLTLRNLVIQNLDGTAQTSSPVYVTNGAGSPTIVLDNTTIQNSNTANPAIFGGGVSTLVQITNGSSVINNVANGSNSDPTTGNRRQGQGGGIYSAGSIEISNSTISGNTASNTGSGGGGGAWAQSGSVTVTNSTVAGNSATQASSQGGGLYSAQYMTITGSTISGNSVSGDGGGVYINYNSTITNSTIVNNTATGLGGGAWTGGIASPRGGATFQYATVAGNTATTGPAVYANSLLILVGSVIDNGTSPAPCTASGAWKTSSFSVSTSSSCLQTSGTGDAVKTTGEIALGALANNGGTTQTKLPGAGSVLIGWINATNPAPSVTTDQRGTARSQPFTAGSVQVNSSDADLSALAATGSGAITLSPTFAAATTAYTGSVANAVTSATVTPTVVAGHGATVTVNGVATTSGSASAAISLTVGANAIPVVVTSQDGTTTKTYTVTITRAASTDATLSSLVITGAGSPITLTPTFASGTYAYTASVANAIASVTATPTRNQANATITVNGTAVTSGTASGAISLNVGATTITTVVTAQDGTTTHTYTVTITRAPSADATLASLALSTGALDPAFAAATTVYTASVGNDAATITVTPTSNQADATIAVNGTAVASGAASAAITLNVGANTITTIVTAQDGTTTLTYTVEVTRAAAPPTPATPATPAKPEAKGALQVLSARAAAGAGGVIEQISVKHTGRISIRGTVAGGTLRARQVACTGGAKITRAGKRTIRCALTAAARHTLATRALSITVVTTFTAPDGSSASATSHVRLKAYRATPSHVTG